MSQFGFKWVNLATNLENRKTILNFHKHLTILFFVIKHQYLTTLSIVFTKSKNGPSFSLKVLITQRHLYLQIKIVKIIWFYLVNSKKILTSKRLRGFSNPSQYSMTLSKRFEWHWSHEWSTKLETILLLEYCDLFLRYGFC